MAAHASPPPPTTDRIAIAFQELLTVIARIQAHRENATSAETFRADLVYALEGAGRQASRKSYTTEQVRMAAFAVVAHLDEAILKSGKPVFADWARAPLRDELFQGSTAGETFYVHIKDLLTADESSQIADVLEVFQLCLLLGYRGRYGDDREGDRQAVMRRIKEKISRIRGGAAPLAPACLPDAALMVPRADRVARYLTVAAVGVVLLALALLLVYRVTLASAISALGMLLLSPGH